MSSRAPLSPPTSRSCSARSGGVVIIGVSARAGTQWRRGREERRRDGRVELSALGATQTVGSMRTRIAWALRLARCEASGPEWSD